MAYSNVGTPRFYVDILSYLKSHGLLSAGAYDTNFFDVSTEAYVEQLKLVGINPTNPIELESVSSEGYNDFLLFTSTVNFKSIMPEKQNFMMALGHNLKSANAQIYSQAGEAINGGDHLGVANVGYFNLDAEVGRYPSYDGFSISLGNDAHDLDTKLMRYRFDNQDSTSSTSIPYDVNIKIGSLLYGSYYDMPHSPQLSLTMTREMDGVKRVRTKGGSDLVNYQYTKPAMWGDSLAAWELGYTDPSTGISPNQALSRTGRRVWDLNFNYLQDSDIFPDLSNIDWQGTYTYDYEAEGKTLLDDDTFYGQVIHKTNGGQLPFVFQPDSNYVQPDGFAICKLEMNSFQFEQVANGVYNIKLKIREVW